MAEWWAGKCDQWRSNGTSGFNGTCVDVLLWSSTHDVFTRTVRRAELLRMGAEYSADELRARLLSFSQARQHATMGFEDVLRWCRMRSLDAADL